MDFPNPAQVILAPRLAADPFDFADVYIVLADGLLGKLAVIRALFEEVVLIPAEHAFISRTPAVEVRDKDHGLALFGLDLGFDEIKPPSILGAKANPIETGIAVLDVRKQQLVAAGALSAVNAGQA